MLLNRQRLRRTLLGQGPRGRIFTNSIPKSGTHLLRRLVEQLPQTMVGAGFLRTDSDREGRQAIRANLDSATARPGIHRVVLKGHQRYEPAVNKLLTRHRYRCVLIIRDPRDVACSLAHWVVDDKHRNEANKAYFRGLGDFDERLSAVIRGRQTMPNEESFGARERWLNEYHLMFRPIGERLGAYAGWLDSPNCLVTRFEDLVGSEGGGEEEVQKREVGRIVQHLGVTLSQQTICRISQSLFTPSARTFRKGRVGGWQTAFKPHHRAMFKEYAHDMLVRFGYECDLNW